jgi:hypothetical protein
MNISDEIFQRQKLPKFGRENPERMDFEFWQYMVQTGHSAWWAREQFGYTNNLQEGPIWTFERFGMSSTSLADGRVIYIGGEHEDHYDPDFSIYNDVIVLHPNDAINIYGYPLEVFPATDFHSATLVDNYIYIIGSLGYVQDRIPETTPVYRLDCQTLEIQKIETTGSNPGWISDHEAELVREKNCIIVTQGKISKLSGNEQVYLDNNETFWFDLSSYTWSSTAAP